MIEFYPDAPNIAAKGAVADQIGKYYDEVRQILPALPKDLGVWLDNWCLIPGTGSGGYAHSPDVMTIAYDLDLPDIALRDKSLRETVFHEAFHLVQGYTEESPRALHETALDPGIYEGCATVFEREYAGASPLWGDYTSIDEAKLDAWRKELMNIPIDDFKDDLYRQWAFSEDPESGERWRLYKVGTWLVDKTLEKNGGDILNFQSLSAREILEQK